MGNAGAESLVCLVNLPRGREHPYAPLGLLCLKGALNGTPFPSLVLDFELLYRTGKLPAADPDLPGTIAGIAADTGARFFGVTTDCSSYPVTIRFCQLLKQRHPRAVVILGGPQATFIGPETIAAFPDAVDFVVRGEGEQALPELVAAVAAGGDPGEVRGIVYRSGGRIVSTPARPPVENLDALPRADFAGYPVAELLSLFSPRGQQPFLPVEAGRGCPKACTFCAATRLWGRHRTKTPGAVVAEMAALHRQYGVNAFEVIQDNIASEPGFLQAFCDQLVRAGAPFRWSCSISTDYLDDERAQLMRSAGCSGVFVGIESGSPDMQRLIGKRLDLEHAEAAVRSCLGLGMTVGTGFILGFPEESTRDLDLTLALATRLRRAGAEVRLSQLSIFPGTPIHRRHLGEIVLEERYSCTSVPLLSFAGQRELVARHPELFSSFYTLPNRLWPQIDLGWMILFFDIVWMYFPQPLGNLLEAAGPLGDGPLDVFRSWDRWRASAHPGAPFTPDFVFYSFNGFLDHFALGLERRRGGDAAALDRDAAPA